MATFPWTSAGPFFAATLSSAPWALLARKLQWSLSRRERNRRQHALHGNGAPLRNVTKELRALGKRWADIKRGQKVKAILREAGVTAVFENMCSKHADAGAWLPSPVVDQIIAQVRKKGTFDRKHYDQKLDQTKERKQQHQKIDKTRDQTEKRRQQHQKTDTRLLLRHRVLQPDELLAGNGPLLQRPSYGDVYIDDLVLLVIGSLVAPPAGGGGDDNTQIAYERAGADARATS